MTISFHNHIFDLGTRIIDGKYISVTMIIKLIRMKLLNRNASIVNIAL